MKPTGKITINDIAKAAAVSKATVSRYLNGHTELMSEETRKRIQTVIETTNYQPSDIARNLKRQSSNMVGVIISDISSPFSSAVIIGIGEYLENRGYTPLFTDCADSPERERKSIDSLLSKGVCGLIVNTTCSDNPYLIETAQRGVPIVLCDRYVKNYNFDIVTSKHKQGMLHLIEHLKKQGYTRPVLFSQNWEKNSVRYIRREGFLEAVEKIYGYNSESDVYLIDSSDSHSAYNQLIAMRSTLLPNDIPVVIGVNSVTTIRAYKAIKKLGLIMPHDIGLCGQEDWDWCNEMNWPTLVSPHITTLIISPTEIGQKCAELLLAKTAQPEQTPQEILLSCEVMVRNSTLLSD